MKTIGSVKEDLSIEKRISIVPETVKKFTNLKFSVILEKNFTKIKDGLIETINHIKGV